MEDLQNLLEKINREGVEKAEAQAKRILDDAKAQADALLKQARDEAKKTADGAAQEAAREQERALASIRQGARDVVLSAQAQVVDLFEKALRRDVDKALADEKTVLALVQDALRAVVGGDAAVALPAKLVPALKAQLAGETSITLAADETVASGFSITFDQGRIEQAFTADVLAAEIARRLRPDLAKLVTTHES